MGEPGDGAGRNVLCVPEFTFSEVMRPYEDFTADYEGQSVTLRPIMFSENGVPLDEIAASGAAGYDPNLVKGLPCKIGQRVVILLPGLETTAETPYVWKFAWRLRSLYDFRNARSTRYNYSLPKQSLGVPDTTGANPGPRVLIPGIRQTIVYNQAEPLQFGEPIVNHLVVEDMQTGLRRWGVPFVPGGADGAIQQGLAPSTVPTYTDPGFEVHELQAIGDELLIALTRAETEGANWDFAGVDLSVATFFSSTYPDAGVYVCRGVSP